MSRHKRLAKKFIVLCVFVIAVLFTLWAIYIPIGSDKWQFLKSAKQVSRTVGMVGKATPLELQSGDYYEVREYHILDCSMDELESIQDQVLSEKFFPARQFEFGAECYKADELIGFYPEDSRSFKSKRRGKVIIQCGTRQPNHWIANLRHLFIGS